MAMEDSSMMSPADIAALTRGNTGFGGDGISWLVLILLFFGFMGGGWGGRYGNGELGQYATAASQQDILFGQHFGQINDRLTNIGNGVCSLGYDMQGNIGQLGKEIALGQANLQLQRACTWNWKTAITTWFILQRFSQITAKNSRSNSYLAALLLRFAAFFALMRCHLFHSLIVVSSPFSTENSTVKNSYPQSLQIRFL